MIRLRHSLPNRLVDIDDIAKATGIDSSKVRAMVTAGALPEPIRLGRALRWEPGLIRDALAGKGAADGPA